MIESHGMSTEALLPGGSLSLLVPEKGLQKVTLFKPKGGPSSLPLLKEGAAMMHLSTNRTEQVGFYRLELDYSDRKMIKAFTVNPPAEESDLTRINLKQIPRFIPLRTKVGRGPTLGEKVTNVREGHELGIAFLWALLLFALLETVFANLSPPRIAGSAHDHPS